MVNFPTASGCARSRRDSARLTKVTAVCGSAKPVSASGKTASSSPALVDGQSGVMVALRGTEIVRVPLIEATRELKLVPEDRYAESEVFFG